jgi:hypothetical protein
VLPVIKIVLGFVFVFGVFRINGLDLLFDPIGWGLFVFGLAQLEHVTGDPFNRAKSCAFAMMCVSVFTVITPDAFDATAGPTSMVISIAYVAGTALTVWLSVDAVIRRIRPYADVTMLDASRWAVAGLTVLGALIGGDPAEFAIVILLAWVVSIVALIVVLCRLARLPYLAPGWRPVEAAEEK